MKKKNINERKRFDELSVKLIEENEDFNKLLIKEYARIKNVNDRKIDINTKYSSHRKITNDSLELDVKFSQDLINMLLIVKHNSVNKFIN